MGEGDFDCGRETRIASSVRQADLASLDIADQFDNIGNMEQRRLQALPLTDASRAVAALAALAQETRLAIFRLLIEHAPEGLTPGAIARKLELPPATLSFHLKELASAGLIEDRRVGASSGIAPMSPP